ncbi:MAG TPA: hypothetical protein VF615_08180 [Longimicrobiaceae bacterium]
MDLLLIAAKAKVAAYRQEINEQFINPAAVDKIQIPGIRALRYIEQYHVASKSGFNEQVAGHMDRAIDAFFSIGGKDTETKEAVHNGVKSLISTALSGFIGSTEAGESEEKVYVVVPENNAFVRADIYTWKYHMSDKALGDNSDTATAYVLCKSVIDHAKLNIDELIYLVSDSLGNRPQTGIIEKQVDLPGGDTTLKRFYADPVNPATPLLKPAPQGVSLDAGKWENWAEVLDGGSGGSPPSIRVVEAYIDELIRVWKKLKQDVVER